MVRGEDAPGLSPRRRPVGPGSMPAPVRCPPRVPSRGVAAAGVVCAGVFLCLRRSALLFTSAARGAQWRAGSQSDGRLDVNSEAAVWRRLQPVYLHNSNSEPGGGGGGDPGPLLGTGRTDGHRPAGLHSPHRTAPQRRWAAAPPPSRPADYRSISIHRPAELPGWGRGWRPGRCPRPLC